MGSRGSNSAGSASLKSRMTAAGYVVASEDAAIAHQQRRTSDDLSDAILIGGFVVTPPEVYEDEGIEQSMVMDARRYSIGNLTLDGNTGKYLISVDNTTGKESPAERRKYANAEAAVKAMHTIYNAQATKASEAAKPYIVR